jgi:uncharacterized FlaG/YvyC family protein
MPSDTAAIGAAAVGPAPVAPIAPISGRSGGSSGSATPESQAAAPLLGSKEAAGAAGAPGDPAAKPTSQQIGTAVESANQQLAQDGRSFRFQFDDQIHQTIVKIVDSKTNQVMDQIPSESMVAVERALAGGSKQGLLLQTNV